MKLQRILLAVLISAILVLSLVSTVYAGDPHTGDVKGRPNQSCEDASTSTTPGNSANALGSAFNPDGISGTHYNETSQYDVACFQNSQPHP